MRSAALLLLSGAAIAAAGCGTDSGSRATRPTLEREDLVAVSQALKGARGSVGEEVAATKSAWPLVANGLPSGTSATARAVIGAAAVSAAKIMLPSLLEEGRARSLTGPAAQVAGLFRGYATLSGRAWKLIRAAGLEVEHGTPASARFARENVGLYIESVYDGHFDLAQIGKRLSDGYRELGGQRAFGRALTQAEVDALARVYSAAADRLHPHVGVRFGS